MTEHQKEIDKFIPLAEAEATRKVTKLAQKTKSVKGKDGKPFNYCFWTEFFHKAMNRMTSAAGLRHC